MEESEEGLQLQQRIIPALPDDVALRILVRLPRALHGEFRRVSHPWRKVLQANGPVNTLREELHIREPWLLFFSVDRDERLRFLLVDLAHRLCREVELPPPAKVRTPPTCATTGFNFAFAMAAGSEVFIPAPCDYLESLWADTDSRCHPLLCFDALTMQWKPSMPLFSEGPTLTCPAIAASNDGGHVYVAGGKIMSMRDRRLSNRVQRLDTRKKTWEVLPDLHIARSSGATVMWQGHVCVIGGFHVLATSRTGINNSGVLLDTRDSRIHNSGEVWDSTSRQWTLIPELWPAHLFNKRAPPKIAVVRDRLYALRELDYSNEIMYFDDASKQQWLSLGVCSFPSLAGLDKVSSYRMLGVGDELVVLCYGKHRVATARTLLEPRIANNQVPYLVILSTMPTPPKPLSWKIWPLPLYANPYVPPLVVHV